MQHAQGRDPVGGELATRLPITVSSSWSTG